MLRFGTTMLVARWLAPEVYGRMAFLLGTFMGVRELLNMGTASAFFTFLSQKSRSRGFVRAFFIWLGVQFLVPLGVIGLLFRSEWVDTIWQGERLDLVLLAFAATFMQHSVWPAVENAGESQRRTIRVQVVSIALAFVHLLAVSLFWWLGILGLYAIFAAVALEFLLAAIVVHRGFAYATDSGTESIDGRPVVRAFRMYIDYCLPLVPYSILGFAYTFTDRWLLQKYGGGVEQAYYAVGAQFASLSLIATSAILRIFWKEIAEAHHQGDSARMGRFYQKTTRFLFLSSAIIIGFLIPWAEELLSLILGSAYVGGGTTLAIMLVYTAHQSIGIIVSTVLLAAERVSLQVLTGSVFMIVSMGATYLVLAPTDALVPGLGMASEGLALKMVLLQFIQVTSVGYLISRIWNWRFDWVHQPVSLLGCILFGSAAHYLVVGTFGGPNLPVPLGLGLAGVVYVVLIAVFVYKLPWLAGMTQDEIIDYLSNARHTIRGWNR